MKGKIRMLLVCCLIVFCSMTAYARDISLLDELVEGDAKVTVTLDAPEGFSERVEVYLNGEAHPMIAQYGYQMTVDLDSKTIYYVVVLSSTDVLDRYEFHAPETLDPSKEDSLHITVTEAPVELTDNENQDTDGYSYIGEDIMGPEEYDFSNGKEYGIVHISCKNYGVFESVTYKLIGESMYDIVLHNDHDFQADVKLPIGSYYESATMDYELCDWVPDTELRFTYEHNGELGTFGKYYNITSDTEVSIDDLIIYMQYGSDTTECDANIINEGIAIMQSVEAQQEHERKELESAFPEQFTQSEAETETIATAEPIETTNENIVIQQIAMIVAGMLELIAIVGTIIWIRRRKR